MGPVTVEELARDTVLAFLDEELSYHDLVENLEYNLGIDDEDTHIAVHTKANEMLTRIYKAFEKGNI